MLGFEVELKVNVEITLEYANFWTRAREVAGILDRYGNDGIALRRRDILGFITAVGPDTISFGGGASLSFGLDIGGVAKAKSLSLALFPRTSRLRDERRRGCRSNELLWTNAAIALRVTISMAESCHHN